MGKIYFASDFHLGSPNAATSAEREARIIRWLEAIEEDAEALYLVGDVFDFWFEYKTVVPKGFVRLLGKLAQLRDGGLPIYFFTGNHDMWMFRYLSDELDIPIYREPIVREYGGKRFFIGHGDGLGPGDHGYKFLKKIFANPLCQWLFRWIHPDIGMRLAGFFSKKSRQAQKEPERFLGEEEEWLYLFARETLKEQPIDYFVFGHRHLPLDLAIDGGESRYINLGEWFHSNSYAVFDGKDMQLCYFEREPSL